MRTFLMLAIAGAALASAGAAAAGPYIEIKDAAARVVVIPEARSDVEVNIIAPNARLPLRVERWGSRVSVIGDVRNRVRSCHAMLGKAKVGVAGRGTFEYDDLPQVVIHTPMDVKVGAGEAVFGAVGRTDSLDLASAGCGDWDVGNVRGHLRVSIAGSGDVRVGTAGSADLRIAGSGDIKTQALSGGLSAVTAGSGDIYAARVTGPLSARIAGSGGITVSDGEVSDMSATIAGSGDISFGGVAQSLKASVVGSGDVRAAEVTGPVRRSVAGSGDIRVGR